MNGLLEVTIKQVEENVQGIKERKLIFELKKWDKEQHRKMLEALGPNGEEAAEYLDER